METVYHVIQDSLLVLENATEKLKRLLMLTVTMLTRMEYVLNAHQDTTSDQVYAQRLTTSVRILTSEDPIVRHVTQGMP